MKTWYEGHDKAYVKRKAMGWVGWSEKQEEIDEKILSLEKVIKSNYVPEKGKFLELGCGPGYYTLWAARRGYEVFGVDIAPAAIEWAKENSVKENLKADFRVGNVLTLEGYEDNFFDFILDGNCFHCIIGEDRKLFLKSAMRVLKKGGFFHIGTMCNKLSVDDGSFDEATRCTIYGDIASRYVGFSEDILNEIKEAGFFIADWKIESFGSSGTVQEGLLVDCIKK